MKRDEIIQEIWEYGMDFPNFPINELEDYLRKKTNSKDDINFGLAYVRRTFIKNQHLDEYLIDQSSISNYITLKQNQIAHRNYIISTYTFFVALFTLVITILSLFLNYNPNLSNPIPDEKVMTMDTIVYVVRNPVSSIIADTVNCINNDIRP